MKRKLKTTPTAVVEPGAYIEIEAGVEQSEGKVEIPLYVGEKNQPLKIKTPPIYKRLGKFRVNLNVVEDQGVYNNQVYRKSISMDQERLDDDTPSSETKSSMAGPKFNTTADPGTGLDKCDYLKNAHDNQVAENGREHKQFPWLWVLGAVALAIGASALAISLIR